jgi:hypothetical protein
MQDAADAGAFAAAVAHAYAMNLIALLNMVMAALVAVLVALATVVLLSLSGIALALALAKPTYGWSLGAIPPLLGVISWAESTYAAAEPIVNTVLEAGYSAQQVLRYGAPAAAQVDANLLLRETYAPPAQAGILWPVYEPLPTEDDDPMELCNRGIAWVVRWASPPPSIPAFPFTGALVRRVVEGHARLAAREVCGSIAARAQKVEDGAEMGGEAFQLRFLVTGEAVGSGAEEGVRAANLGKAAALEGAVGTLGAALGRVSFAQAEYYFDGDEPREDWLWHMAWKARLRRFRPPAGAPALLEGQAENAIIH